MDRKLASIQKVIDVQPIPGADKIEVAKILGWSVVTKKDEYKPGDLCVYAEIDSIMPDRAEFAFLKDRNFRIKTVKLRGQISQGIAFKLDVLPPGTKIEEGLDVTDMLGVTKYLPRIPAQLMGEAKGEFPSFIPRTDEQRIQSAPGVLDRHKDRVFYVTEKVDGSSMTAYLHEGIFGVCSRNLDLIESPENAYWKIARELKLEEKLRALGYDAAIQGELFGMGVQANRYRKEKAELGVFSIYDISQRKFLDYAEFVAQCKEWQLQTVPMVDDSFVLNHTVDDLIKAAEGNSKLNSQMPREGIVLRSLQECRDPEIGRLSFKVINNQYLLKFEE